MVGSVGVLGGGWWWLVVVGDGSGGGRCYCVFLWWCGEVRRRLCACGAHQIQLVRFTTNTDDR